LGSELADQDKTARLVTVLYSSNMLIIALAVTWSWAYLSRNPRLLREGLIDNFRASFPRTAMVCLPYLAAVLVAFFSPLGSLTIDAVAVVYLAISTSALERVEGGPLEDIER
jgi:hypothetical protein